MSTAKEILELKFEGNEISPDKVKPSEVAKLIVEFEKALTTTIEIEHRIVNDKEPLFTIETIKHASIGILFKVGKNDRAAVRRSYKTLTTAIENNDYSKLPEETVKSIRSIANFAKKYNCSANFRRNGKRLSTIGPNAEIKYVSNSLLRGDTTIYGELFDAGGDNPNLHVKINNDYTVIIDTDRATAKALAAKYLYDQVGLRGHAKWDLFTSKIVEFKLYEVLDYVPGNVKKTFDELRNITSGYWDNKSDDDIKKNLLRD